MGEIRSRQQSDAAIPVSRFRLRNVKMIPKNSSDACFMNSLGMPSGPQALLFFSLLMLFFSSCMVNILLRSRLGGELLIMGVFMLSVSCEKRLLKYSSHSSPSRSSRRVADVLFSPRLFQVSHKFMPL